MWTTRSHVENKDLFSHDQDIRQITFFMHGCPDGWKEQSLWPWKKVEIRILVDFHGTAMNMDEWRRCAICLTYTFKPSPDGLKSKHTQHTEAPCRGHQTFLQLVQGRAGTTCCSCGFGRSQDAYRNTSKVGTPWLVPCGPGLVFQVIFE